MISCWPDLFTLVLKEVILRPKEIPLRPTEVSLETEEVNLGL